MVIVFIVDIACIDHSLCLQVGTPITPPFFAREYFAYIAITTLLDGQGTLMYSILTLLEQPVRVKFTIKSISFPDLPLQSFQWVHQLFNVHYLLCNSFVSLSWFMRQFLAVVLPFCPVMIGKVLSRQVSRDSRINLKSTC